jgi:hypothetical protein
VAIGDRVLALSSEVGSLGTPDGDYLKMDISDRVLRIKQSRGSQARREDDIVEFAYNQSTGKMDLIGVKKLGWRPGAACAEQVETDLRTGLRKCSLPSAKGTKQCRVRLPSAKGTKQCRVRLPHRTLEDTSYQEIISPRWGELRQLNQGAR